LTDSVHHCTVSWCIASNTLLSLLTTTSVAWIRFTPLFVCLFFRTTSQKPTQLHDIQVLQDESWKPMYFVVKRSRSQRLCRSSDRTQYCRCCVRKARWVFPAIMHRCTSNDSDTAFFLRYVPASACRWTLGFSRRGCLHSCGSRRLLIYLQLPGIRTSAERQIEAQLLVLTAS